jgi:energy-converting hydrogenase B subunit C
VIASIGILRFSDDKDRIIYLRIQLLGIVDIAGVLAMIGLNQWLLAGMYFVLCPIVAHAMANAYYYGEEDHNKKSLLNDHDSNNIDDEKIDNTDEIVNSNGK